MLTVKPICKKSKARKDGTSVVYIQYCFSSGRRTLLNTGIAIPSNYWNEKVLKISDSLPTTFGMVAELNKKIRDLIRKVEDIIDLGDLLYIQDLLTFVSKYFDAASGIEEITRRIKNQI
ncbi:MAG: Arm DNA-binding domain-containing protein, partial [Ginsengibacter sp.]